MFVIIGGSGMLFEASRILAERRVEPVLLCGRRVSRYQPILRDHQHARFFPFDFSVKADYGRLRQILSDTDARLGFLVWVHSPYYAYLADLLVALRHKAGQVYLVQGSQSRPLPKALADWQNLSLIRLGRHVTENRWLTHQEICRQVLQEMGEGRH